MIILYIDIKDGTHANFHTKHADCGLHEYFLRFFVNAILFYDQKGLP